MELEFEAGTPADARRLGHIMGKLRKVWNPFWLLFVPVIARKVTRWRKMVDLGPRSIALGIFRMVWRLWRGFYYFKLF